MQKEIKLKTKMKKQFYIFLAFIGLNASSYAQIKTIPVTGTTQQNPLIGPIEYRGANNGTAVCDTINPFFIGAGNKKNLVNATTYAYSIFNPTLLKITTQATNGTSFASTNVASGTVNIDATDGSTTSDLNINQLRTILSSDNPSFLGFQYSGAAAFSISTAGTDYTIFNRLYNDIRYASASAISGTLNYVPKFTPDGSHLGNSLIFDNGTNIGIGTNAPSQKLDILSETGLKLESASGGFLSLNAYTSAVHYASVSTGMGENLIFPQTGNSNIGIGITIPGALVEIHRSGQANTVMFQVSNDIAGNDSTFEIDQQGFVGINRTPQKALDILTNNGIRITSGTGGLLFFEPHTSGHTFAEIATGGAGENLYLNTGVANVGIGTSSPSAKLEVDGSLRFVTGNEGLGKVLTSDASGNATWQASGELLHTISTPTTASTVTLTNNYINIISPAGTIASLTITFPNSPSNNDFVEVTFDQIITTITYTAGTGGATIKGQINGVVGGQKRWDYDAGTNTWY